ncbi:MAG: lipoyl(octanoyl) transferase LipB [Chloroflexota bacterium]
MNTLTCEWFGRVPYEEGLVLQETAVQERSHSLSMPDKLILLEHPHTFTFGLRSDPHNLLINEAQLAKQGVSVHHVRRGGDITYHGPNQLVGYPIFNIKRTNSRLGYRPLNVRAFIQTLENCLIHALSDFGILGWREDKYPGVWVEKNGSQAKIAAIGVHINQYRISSHGFALNVDPDMSFFDKIIPCGIQEYQVTSMSEVLKRPLSLSELLPHIESAFKHNFKFDEVKRDAKIIANESIGY